MPQFEVILPEGTVILRNLETGEKLRLSAESGPLTLGRVTLEFAFAPAPGATGPSTSASASASTSAPSSPEAAHPEAEEPGGKAPQGRRMASHSEASALDAAARTPSAATAQDAVPLKLGFPGFPTEGEALRALHENPFLSPDEPIFPSEKPAEERRSIRALEAPFDALTEADFEATLTSLSAEANNMEGEIEFLQEIDGDPDDIAELEGALEALKDTFARTSRRFEAWKKAVRHGGANEAKARAERIEAAAQAAEEAALLARESGVESFKKPLKAR